MNPDTGEIKNFEGTKTPIGWNSLPEPGTEVEVVMPPHYKRGRTWKVVEYVEGKPGRVVLEATPETRNKLTK